MKKISIHQPNFLPWIGYFNKIRSADIFVFLDDVQFSKGGYTNRVQVLTPYGVRWLTVPVLSNFGCTINNLKFADNDWCNTHVNLLKSYYRKSDSFKKNIDDLIYAYQSVRELDFVSANIFLIKFIAGKLDIQTEYIKSSDIPHNSTSDDLIVEIMLEIAPGGTYLSGAGGSKYQDPEKFINNGLGIDYVTYKPIPYPQLNYASGRSFVPGLSIIDPILNIGWDETAKLILST